MISDSRKRFLGQFANKIADAYCINGMTALEDIAKDYSITYSYGNYANSFDGLLEYEKDHFHIYINVKSDYNRHRFSFAHELAHFFINEHRTSLTKGKSLHKSFHTYFAKNIIEYEADYFASNILMPENRFKEFVFRRKFSIELIQDLQKNLAQVSQQQSVDLLKLVIIQLWLYLE